MALPYTIREYEGFTRAQPYPGSKYTPLPETTFDQLEKFILANRNTSDTEFLELMSLSAKKNFGKIISAKNYVGLITMNDGTEIEILPKIYNPQTDNPEVTRKIFLNMLKTVNDVPYKTFNVSHLNVERVNIFEVFIRMFINEVFVLIKRGLKASYAEYSDNERFYKGKMLFPQHLRRNLVHKERFFVEYDLFSTNRPENRLIKSTIRFLQHLTMSRRNKKDLSILLASFDGIDYSGNYPNDFSQYIKNRNIREYDQVMGWCKVFLLNRSFTTYSGSEVAYALLFPMEQVFESYIATKLKNAIDLATHSMFTQDKRHHLFDSPTRKFQLRPDIVITNKISGLTTVLDTKWKLLSSGQYNYGISQADMYQMYAYHKKYAANEVILLYPLTEEIESINTKISFQSNDGVYVSVAFIDLVNINESIQGLISELIK